MPFIQQGIMQVILIIKISIKTWSLYIQLFANILYFNVINPFTDQQIASYPYPIFTQDFDIAFADSGHVLWGYAIHG